MTGGGPKQKYREQQRQEYLVRQRNELADTHPGEWGDRREAVTDAAAVAKIVERLQLCADDPMSADHAEVSKRLLTNAATALEQEHAARVKAESERDAHSADAAHSFNLATEWKARAEAAERDNAQLRDEVRGFLRCEYESASHGLLDCIDNDGGHYQSQFLADQIKRAEELVGTDALLKGSKP